MLKNPLEMTVIDALEMASKMPPHTQAARLAVQACILQGRNPAAFVKPQGGPLASMNPVPNWQLLIAEQMMLSALRISLRDGPTAGTGLSIG